MENNSIVLILPYFGHLPNYFKLWVKTAECNKTVDFVILTNHPEEVESSKHNIKIIQTDFEDVQNRIYKLLGNKVKIQDPYKLCEYKPAYGELFPELISGYDFWGFCDPDLIWGDIRNFITDEILEKFDKFYFLGHLTIYRNSHRMNTLYRSYSGKELPDDVLDYKLAFGTKYVKQFSEMAGTSAWYPYVGVKTYSNFDFADVNYRRFDFESTYNNGEKESERYMWKAGKVYRILKNGIDEEVVYVHLQKRKMKFSSNFDFSCSAFFIKPNVFSLTKDKNFWNIEEKTEKNYENQIKRKEKDKKIKKLFSSDFLLYKIKLKINGKKIPKFPSMVFIDKYYRR